MKKIRYSSCSAVALLSAHGFACVVTADQLCGVLRFIPLLYGDNPLPDSSFSASSVVGPAMDAKYVKIKGSADDSTCWGGRASGGKQRGDGMLIDPSMCLLEIMHYHFKK